MNLTDRYMPGMLVASMMLADRRRVQLRQRSRDLPGQHERRVRSLGRDRDGQRVESVVCPVPLGGRLSERLFDGPVIDTDRNGQCRLADMERRHRTISVARSGPCRHSGLGSLRNAGTPRTSPPRARAGGTSGAR